MVAVVRFGKLDQGSNVVIDVARHVIARGNVDIEFLRRRGERGPFTHSFAIAFYCLAAWPRPVAVEDLIYLLYGDDPEGGPEAPAASIAGLVHRLNRALRVLGVRLRARRPPASGYQAVIGALP